MKTAIGFIFCLICLAGLRDALAGGAATQPFAGVTIFEKITADPPLHLHVVIVDLANPKVHLKLSRGGDSPQPTGMWNTTLLPVSAMARRDGLDLAINGSMFQSKDFLIVGGQKIPYFPGNWAHANGWTLSDGKLWRPIDTDRDCASLVIFSDGRARIGRFDHPPTGAKEMVSSVQQIVSAGLPTAFAAQTERAPRTAVGLDAGAGKLYMVVVDGRRPDYSAGMTLAELAAEMIRLGCKNALNLDGGGSSTLVMRMAGDDWRVLNRPSDGRELFYPDYIERSVANCLGVIVDGDAPTTEPESK